MVKRPDPNTVRRQPMARAQGEIAWTQRDEQRPQNDIFVEHMIDIDALNLWLDKAEIITEGRIEDDGGLERLFGSTALIVPVSSADRRLLNAADNTDVLLQRLQGDARVQRVIYERIFREVARLMGVNTPPEFDAHTRLSFDGVRLSWHGDFDSIIQSRTAHFGSL
ncbi:MAG: hypothetical protein ACON3Z_16675 [Bradymonadia bacterium]